MKAMLVDECHDEKCVLIFQVSRSILTVLRYALSCLLMSAASARAEAPPFSQEFWNYFVEFGDTQGELFDPSDYAAVVNLPADAQRKHTGTVSESDLKQVPGTPGPAREQQQ